MIDKIVSHDRINEKLHSYGPGAAYNAEDTHSACGIPSVLRELARGVAR